MGLDHVQLSRGAVTPTASRLLVGEKRKSDGEKVGEKAENKAEQLEKKSVGKNVGEKVEDKAEQYKLARGRAGAVASAAASENPEGNLTKGIMLKKVQAGQRGVVQAGQCGCTSWRTFAVVSWRQVQDRGSAGGQGGHQLYPQMAVEGKV